MPSATGSSQVPPAGGAAKLVQVERYGSKNSARVVVFTDHAVPYKTGKLAAQDGKGPRLFVDFAGVTYDGVAQYDVGGLVERVRLGQHDDGVRVVLDLERTAQEKVFDLPEPFRVVIDLATDFGPGRGRNPKPGALRRVVLDPGHGGHDPGATGLGGLHEKDVALDVAHRAAPLIARELGVDTLLTRDTDEFVPLDERVAKANAFTADLFISIHCNASESAESHGVMSFVLDASRDQVGERLAARENSASTTAVQSFDSVVDRLLDQPTAKSSMHFAWLLQRASMASLNSHYQGIADGGVRPAGFFVLAGAHMPAVLFETSFISNPTEELRLDSERYRQRLADGIVNAIRAYRDGR
jgi:N-acetylmuramoyl-L-alanine amidase